MDNSDYQPLSPRLVDPRGGFTSSPAFQIDANMDGPRLRDGNTGRLGDPYRLVNDDC